MEAQYLALVMFIVLLLGVFTGFPLAFVLLGTGMIFGLAGWGTAVFDQMASRTFGIMANDALVAVPLFIFMGYMMERSGIADGLFGALQEALGRLKGSLAITTVLLGTILAATTGVVGASVTMLGLITLPPMLKRNYDIPLATGTILAGGTLGILIPPSVMLILYGPMAGLSIARLFAAAVMPGLLLAGLYIAYIAVRCYLKPELGPALPKAQRTMTTAQLLAKLATSLVPPLVLILAVLGSIFFGLAAPTEAAAMGGFGAAILCAAYGKFNWPNLKDVVFLTLKASSMILILTVGANVFTGVFLALGGGGVIESFLLASALPPWGILALVMVIVFILGMFLDWIAILLILIPVLSPIIKSLGFDPLWFALLVCVNLQTSYLTPPFAYSIFYLKGVAPKGVEVSHIYRGVIPFVILQLIGLTLCILFPQIITWLPKVIYG
ncbi:MAG: TRAP transporter large permease subunit [Thermodesulfobacteriota bacterium]|nr:TRAP transporter large permease subunit [Thermodesulfobacteriota bacterium]